ncbi:MAG: SDR family NAD(P)-dependent oxidoreductase [Actinobacteria bacterium]|nr:SDR family NAD(P)-dependent oxidoreductase [Actinomycetota bacterium]MBV9935868.1 SDR family NAD(P)-dependent oxidoreductase [Actinomycetota bacterium]
MTEHRFDGRVAIVTGGGRGIGQAYAQLLAERGAAVVVNDADDIDGVTYVADVSSPDGAAGLVAATVEQYGHIDIVINNAGIIRWAGFPDADDDNLAAHLDVHVRGSFLVTRAAWPHMAERGYGRVVMTASTGIFGLPGNVSYATAKGGVIGLTRALAFAGKKHGIKVNAIAPAASTRMAGDGGPDMPAELVAPMAAFLAHQDCPVTGEIYTAGGGRFARLFIGSTPGYVAGEPSVEDVATHWAEINDEAGYTVPANLQAWAADFMKHLSP